MAGAPKCRCRMRPRHGNRVEESDFKPSDPSGFAAPARRKVCAEESETSTCSRFQAKTHFAHRVAGYRGFDAISAGRGDHRVLESVERPRLIKSAVEARRKIVQRAPISRQ